MKTGSIKEMNKAYMTTGKPILVKKGKLKGYGKTEKTCFNKK